jgi:hypothetical protein
MWTQINLHYKLTIEVLKVCYAIWEYSAPIFSSYDNLGVQIWNIDWSLNMTVLKILFIIYACNINLAKSTCFILSFSLIWYKNWVLYTCNWSLLRNTSRSVDFGTGISKLLQRTDFLGLWANDCQMPSTTLAGVLGIHMLFCINTLFLQTDETIVWR